MFDAADLARNVCLAAMRCLIFLASILLLQKIDGILGNNHSCNDACQRQQRQALVDFYNALDGDHWRIKQGWLSDQPYCEWEGVACCGQDNEELSSCEHPGMVLSIEMYTNNASGVIPDSALEKLAFGLVHLDIR